MTWPRLALCGVVFCVVAWASNGLVAGAGDQGIHEVFIAAAGGSEPFAGDLLHGGARHHPTVFFALVAALRRLADPGWVGLGGVLVAWFGTGMAVGALSRALGAPWPRWLIAAAATAPAQLALGGAPTVDPLLLPRLLALPVELAAVVLLVRRRWAPAFALGGLSLLLHAPSGSVVLVGLAAAWLPGWRSARVAPLWSLLGLVPAALLAQPGLGAVAFPADVWPALQARLAHHLLPGSFPAASWAVAVAWCAVVVGSARTSPPLRRFAVGAIGWALLAGTAGPALRITLLLNLEPWQAMRLVVALGPTALLAALPQRTPRWELGLGLALVVLCTWTSAPAWRSAPADVVALGEWAQRNTPPGAVFVLPPDLPPGFRPAAQRPTFGTWKDGGELQFDPELGRTWTSRMAALCACDPLVDLPETTGFARSRAGAARLGAAFDARPDADLLALAAAEGADYVVRRGPGPGEVVGPYRVLSGSP